MKITKKHLIKLIKEEISNVRESDAHDAIGSDLDVVMAKLPMETVKIIQRLASNMLLIIKEAEFKDPEWNKKIINLAKKIH